LNKYKDWRAVVVGDEPRDKLEFNHKRLTIPHPEMINRDFVLIPLYEVTNYNFMIPKYGKLLQYI